MTAYLSQRGRTVDPEPFPMTCPKCGQPTRVESVARHLRTEHPDAIGVATLIADPSVAKAFAYVSPAHGQSGAWWIVWLDLPISLVKMRTAEWAIAWEMKADGRPEGDG